MLKALDGGLSNADALDGDRIDGVKVLGISEGASPAMRRSSAMHWQPCTVSARRENA
ncbi:hypothetical protein [Corynebacterium anserum]|uniref:hypothetical protein n=1 Tax=Corynebacterium anserum TaxID=2684406 RepID=UPI001FE4DDA7|nr:hypothetical protein [Corynebacterium anserum]